MKLSLAIYGTGGCGRDVDLLVPDADVVFVTDTPGEQGRIVRGKPVIGFDALTGPDHRHRRVVLAVSDTRGREALAARCKAAGLRFGTARAGTCHSYPNAEVGEGAVFYDHTLICADTRIGRHFHCYMYSYVAHDCRIGDFVTLAPRVSCNGYVEIEDGVFVGAGAILRNGSPDRSLRIGRGAVIGMGAVVVADVEPGATMVGCPARPLKSSRRPR